MKSTHQKPKKNNGLGVKTQIKAGVVPTNGNLGGNIGVDADIEIFG